VVLAEPEHVEANLVGQLDLLQQFLNASRVARRTRVRCGHKTVDADLHGEVRVRCARQNKRRVD
jgi:hypothetical protein